MPKFSVSHSDPVVRTGYATYVKSSLRVIQGDAYLTRTRLVYCRKNPVVFYILLGPLLGHLVKGKDILFDIPLADIYSVVKKRHGLGRKYEIATRGGITYALGFMKEKAWIRAIREAVCAAVPGVVVTETDGSLHFG